MHHRLLARVQLALAPRASKTFHEALVALDALLPAQRLNVQASLVLRGNERSRGTMFILCITTLGVVSTNARIILDLARLT